MKYWKEKKYGSDSDTRENHKTINGGGVGEEEGSKRIKTYIN